MARRRLFDYRTVPRERRARILLCMFLWSVLSYMGVSRFLLGSTEVIGDSMLPTLHPGDRLLVNYIVMRIGRPERGDIVSIHMDDGEFAVKRVIGLPGDRLQIRRGHVHVNGNQLSEPYLDRGVYTTPGLLTTNAFEVSEDCYFLLGDNRSASMDSRYFGAVPRGEVMGRIVPPSR